MADPTFYTGTQIADMPAYIQAAELAAQNGSPSGVISNLEAYYNVQTSVRDYAGLAEEVVANNTLNGNIANANLQNYFASLGQQNYASEMPIVALDLAEADFSIIQNNGYIVPTVSQDEQEHL